MQYVHTVNVCESSVHLYVSLHNLSSILHFAMSVFVQYSNKKSNKKSKAPSELGCIDIEVGSCERIDVYTPSLAEARETDTFHSRPQPQLQEE